MKRAGKRKPSSVASTSTSVVTMKRAGKRKPSSVASTSTSVVTIKRAGKRKLSSAASVAGTSTSVVTETGKKRRKLSPCPSSTKKVKKSSSVRSPTTSGESRPPNTDTSTGYTCPICLESTRKNEMTSLQCFHAFHRACINEWLIENKRCPVCRQETTTPLNARSPPQNARSPAPPQNARSPAPPQNARPPAPPQTARPPAPPQNARPPLNNQRLMTFGGLQAFPGLRAARNNTRLNGGIGTRLNNGSFTSPNNNGIDMSINICGFEVRLNNGGFMIFNNRGTRRNNNF